MVKRDAQGATGGAIKRYSMVAARSEPVTRERQVSTRSGLQGTSAFRQALCQRRRQVVMVAWLTISAQSSPVPHVLRRNEACHSIGNA